MEMLQQVEAMDVLDLAPDPPLSPELRLGTMNTSDMFQTAWDTSSGVDSGSSGGSSPPLADPPEEDLLPWDTTHLLHADLDDFLPDDAELLSFVDPPLTAGDDYSFLQDTSSNISFASNLSLASDVSSSSSTITSYSIPQSPDRWMLEEGEEEGSPPSGISFSNSYSFETSPSKNVSCKSSQPKYLSSSTPASKAMPTFSPKKEIKTERIKKNKRKEMKNTRKHGKIQTPKKRDKIKDKQFKRREKEKSPKKKDKKENQLSPSKRKVFNILDSSIKWSDLSSSEQTVVGEGLELVLTQCLGLRERLELMAALEPGAPTHYGEGEWVISLDDHKLEVLRSFLRNLDGTGEQVPSTTKGTKKILKDHSWHNVNHKADHKNNGSTREPKGQHPEQKGQARHIKENGMYHNGLNRNGHGKDNNKGYSGTQTVVDGGKRPHHKTAKSKGQTVLTQEKTPEKKGRGIDLLRLRTRSRKEYRQLMREKRSGLFEREEVVTVSSAASSSSVPAPFLASAREEQEEEEEVDIMG